MLCVAVWKVLGYKGNEEELEKPELSYGTDESGALCAVDDPCDPWLTILVISFCLLKGMSRIFKWPYMQSCIVQAAERISKCNIARYVEGHGVEHVSHIDGLISVGLH